MLDYFRQHLGNVSCFLFLALLGCLSPSRVGMCVKNIGEILFSQAESAIHLDKSANFTGVLGQLVSPLVVDALDLAVLEHL